ncbi:MAG: hypothetical protein A2X35_05745 [Elusimicrobia bacterium GWA2_61_42]|nr:MAG: hypothetical protein A2X35_05745 [Elusimicrobia bacterium GWA2_61_42]OGR74134.1 MAG: hypothetical protein A2X38_10920 [Elusimicrobia bacterium GWC2_61_25]
MHILNYYFTPFAVILILFAIFFSEPERKVTYASFAILAAAFVSNYWLGKNMYRFMRWSRHIRALTVWINLAVSAALFYLLSPYWAPMWLLFLTAPSASAMYMKKWQVFLTALGASAIMIALYYARSVAYGDGGGMGSQLWGMALTQAVFIVFFSLFTAAMAEMIVKVRDSQR